MKPEIDEAARELFNQLMDGADNNIPLQHARTAKATCLLLAILRDKGLITDVGIDDLITAARY
jgi:hypothetical protein